MFGNGDGPPTVTQDELPKLMDHEEYGRLRETLAEIERELEQVRKRVAEIADKRGRYGGFFGDGAASEREHRVAEILGEEPESGPTRESLTAELAKLKQRQRDLERARRTARRRVRTLEGRACHELLEEADDLQETYRGVVGEMHRAAVELAKWADAERRLRDGLERNGLTLHGKLHPVSLPMALVESRRNSPMIQFLKRCEERHGLTCDLDY